MTTLTEQIREAARVAEEVSMYDDFDAMSWLDLMLEDNPESFDCFFSTNWEKLSENERQERATAIRKVL
jgi:4-oxalocrotonate tautomerase